MTPWPKEELHRIAGADDLHVAPFCEDGESRLAEFHHKALAGRVEDRRGIRSWVRFQSPPRQTQRGQF